METEQPKKFIPLKKRFKILTSPPSSDDEVGYDDGKSRVRPEPSFIPPPPYKQQALDKDELSLVAEGYNNTQGRSRDTAILQVRLFNNWVKKALIMAYCPPGGAVLDICGGRGGDLRKFSDRKISFLVHADNASVSVAEAERRYLDGRLPFPAYFICADCFSVDLARLLPAGMCFDFVSCQFALHYSFRNEQSARMLLYNVAARLRPGGFFAGTTVDYDVFMERYRRAQGRAFENSVYRVCDIGFERDARPGFGMDYLFYLKESVPDLKESLVPLELLRGLAREYGLELVLKERFSNDLQRTLRTESRPPRVQGDQQEVCSLYCVFVFRKVLPFAPGRKKILSSEDIRRKVE